MNAAFKTVGLIGKYNSPGIVDPLLRLATYLESRGVDIVLDRLTAGHVGPNKFTVLPLEDVGKRADLAVVIDADGRPVVPPISEDLTVKFARDLPTVCKAFALPFAQLMLPEFGEYAIKVAIDRISLASVPLYVQSSR